LQFPESPLSHRDGPVSGFGSQRPRRQPSIERRPTYLFGYGDELILVTVAVGVGMTVPAFHELC
jgi:hypothetical protein